MLRTKSRTIDSFDGEREIRGRITVELPEKGMSASGTYCFDTTPSLSLTFPKGCFDPEMEGALSTDSPELRAYYKSLLADMSEDVVSLLSAGEADPRTWVN